MAVTLNLSGNAGDVTPRELRRQSTHLLLPVFFFSFVLFVKMERRAEVRKCIKYRAVSKCHWEKKKAECFCKATDEGPEWPWRQSARSWERTRLVLSKAHLWSSLLGKEHCRCLGPRPDLPSGSSQGSNRNEPGRPGVSEISRPEADRYCVVSLTCGIKKKKGQILTNRLWKSGCQGVGGGGSRERLVRRHELSPIRWTRSGEPTCNMVTVT